MCVCTIHPQNIAHIFDTVLIKCIACTQAGAIHKVVVVVLTMLYNLFKIDDCDKYLLYPILPLPCRTGVASRLCLNYHCLNRIGSS